MSNQEQGWEGGDEIDLDNIPSAPPPFVESVFRFKVQKGELAPTKEGKPQIGLTLQLTENMVDGAETSRVLRYQNIQLTGNSAFRFQNFMASVGSKPASGAARDVKEWLLGLEGVEGYARVGLGKPKSKDSDKPGFPEVKRYLSSDELEDAIEAARAKQADAALAAE
jgi:hypothetical protein